MPSLSQRFLGSLRFSARQTALIRHLGEVCGRQQLFAQQAPAALELLRQSATVQSVESSNRIEGVIAEPGRVEALVQERAAPLDRTEQEIAGYRDALEMIHSSYGDMRFTPNQLLQLHSALSRYLSNPGGKWKPTDNEIIERDARGSSRVRFRATPAVLTPQAVAELAADYRRAIEAGEADALVLVPLAILDLLCIHPFHDGNGRIARLTTLLLLYHAGYLVGRYISLERIVEDSKKTYYEALERSSAGWHDSQHDPHPWFDYFWGVLSRAYGEFEARVENLKGSKTDQVRNAVFRRRDPFRILEIEADCPGVSRDMVRHVLRQLKKQGLVVPVGFGRGTRWRRMKGAPGSSESS